MVVILIIAMFHIVYFLHAGCKEENNKKKKHYYKVSQIGLVAVINVITDGLFGVVHKQALNEGGLFGLWISVLIGKALIEFLFINYFYHTNLDTKEGNVCCCIKHPCIKKSTAFMCVTLVVDVFSMIVTF